MALRNNLKKGLLLVALCLLLYFGAGLLEGFLPYEWRHVIDQRFDLFFPHRVYAPHPDMDWEFEMHFRQHPSHRLIEFVVLGILVTADGYIISRVWRALRKASRHP